MPSTHFLNVDLDIASLANLSPLVEAIGDKAIVLSSDSNGSSYRVSLELSTNEAVDAQTSIASLVEVVIKLPSAARAIWDQAIVRDFNVGIQAGTEPHAFVMPLLGATLRAVTDIGGRVVVTVYGAEG
jgi:hypothetical protein